MRVRASTCTDMHARDARTRTHACTRTTTHAHVGNVSTPPMLANLRTHARAPARGILILRTLRVRAWLVPRASYSTHAGARACGPPHGRARKSGGIRRRGEQERWCVGVGSCPGQKGLLSHIMSGRLPGAHTYTHTRAHTWRSSGSDLDAAGNLQRMGRGRGCFVRLQEKNIFFFFNHEQKIVQLSSWEFLNRLYSARKRREYVLELRDDDDDYRPLLQEGTRQVRAGSGTAGAAPSARGPATRASACTRPRTGRRLPRA